MSDEDYLDQGMMPLHVRVRPTEYTVTGLDADDVNNSVWCLKIEWRGHDTWAVTKMSHYCLKDNGEWSFEPSPSNRTPGFLEHHRFTLAQAQRLAVQAFPRLVINGLRVEKGKLVPE